MGNWVGVITNAGAELINAWSGGSTLSIYAASAGTGTVAAASMAEQAALVNQKQSASIVSKSVVDDAGGLKIQVQITAPAASYTLNQIGIWAKLDGGAGKLLALYQKTDGISIPASSESPDFAYTFYGYIAVSNAGSVSVTIDSSATATMSAVQAAIASAIAGLQPIIAATAPTTSTVGVVGQAYIDTASLRIWRCTKANNGSYTWDQLLNVLKGSGAPTTSTVGVVGQVYADTKATDLYICQKASTADGYNWVGIITSGNISSQNTSFANIASTAYYSIGSVPRGVPALRNEYFVAKDEYDENADAPTNEGVICWLYG